MIDIEPPEPWSPIEHLCRPGPDSKAFKHPTGANVSIINMGNGLYIAQKEDEHGEFEEVKWISYWDAAQTIIEWMEEQ